MGAGDLKLIQVKATRLIDIKKNERSQKVTESQNFVKMLDNSPLPVFD